MPTLTELAQARDAIRHQALADEQRLLRRLVTEAHFDPALCAAISRDTAALVERLRREGRPTFLQSFLGEYGLSTEEGVALMSMAEAFLRVPDADTLDELIAEKISGSDWQSHSGQASSFLVNASTWALMLSGRLLTEDQHAGLIPAMRELLKRVGEPVVRVAMTEAMEQLGNHFVVGETIDAALARTGKDSRYDDYSFSFDMLGEAALTAADAEHYFQSYRVALEALAKAPGDDIRRNSGISVKLSALHPRFELLQKARSVDLLEERMEALCRLAAEANVNLNIDGEEAERMEFTLDLFEALARSDVTRDWQGLGLVVQAYARNSGAILDWLQALAVVTDRRFMVRLVKGAYWDTEIKRAQVLGLDSYPVFTRKQHTDIAYLCAARKLMQAGDRLYPMFATHNAHSVTALLALAKESGLAPSDYEFQRLYGMGEDLHEFTRLEQGTRHRIYAPVGQHEDLLAYLVRRLLENGANSSFVHQLTDASVPAAVIAADPFALAGESGPGITAPSALFERRVNSPGFDLANGAHLARIEALRGPWRDARWQAVPLLAVAHDSSASREIRNPARPEDLVGTVVDTDLQLIDAAVAAARDYSAEWQQQDMASRARLLERGAELLEQRFGEFAALLCREAGKTLTDVIGEWREAIDFLRYYAQQATSNPELQQRRARGVFVCIAPWNFPLSIFTGQVAAALVTGNTVLAKPAEQASLIGFRLVQLLHEAGVPAAALQLATGDGDTVGAALTRQAGIDGVCFTGSTEVAALIRRTMAAGAPVEARLIAETGGINAMLVDSTALPEQTVADIVTSAFFSAGQRCSALRMLYLQDDIAERFIAMLIGAMDTLRLGDPWQWHSDVGPAIDAEAHQGILAYVDRQSCRHRLPVPAEGYFVPPVLIEVGGIQDIEREVFGPVLHVARYRAEDLDRVVEDINRAGYGLTASIHSRLTQKVDRCIARLNVGNLYVNRNQIGAVVESQPFGGQGLSGTGPKAGGPLYLQAFTQAAQVERSAAPVPDQAVTASRLQEAIDSLDNSHWRRREQRARLLLNVRPGSSALAACSLAPRRTMPGPTGERNIYELRPVGCCLCLGPTAQLALDQALQALAFGNSALVCCAADDSLATTLLALQELDAPLAWLDGTVQVEALREVSGIAVVSWCGEENLGREFLMALADRQGPLVRFVTEPVAPAEYLTEVHVCNDITSAGGNVELMAANS